MARWAFGVLALALALAGCGDDGAPKADDPDIDDDVDIEKGYGAVAGIALDNAVRPLAGVTIAIDRNQTATTGEDGQFVFEKVLPGPHVLDAAASGFLPRQVPIVVEEGKVTEARVTLEFDPTPQPYGLPLHFTGRIEASDAFGTFVADLVIEEVTGEASPLCLCSFNVSASPDVKAITYEAIWEDSVEYPTGPGDLYYEIFPTNNVTTETIMSGFEVSPIHQYFLRNETWNGLDADGEFTVRLTGGTEPRYQQDYELFITLWFNGPGDPEYSALTET